MSERIPQAVAKTVVFRAYLASDGKTPATAKTIAITISKNGGAFGNPNAGATNATEISSGFYKFTLSTTDTNTRGPLAWRGAEATIDDAGDCYEVVENPFILGHVDAAYPGNTPSMGGIVLDDAVTSSQAVLYPDFLKDKHIRLLSDDYANVTRVIQSSSYDAGEDRVVITFDEPIPLAFGLFDVDFEITKESHTHTVTDSQSGLATQASVDALSASAHLNKIADHVRRRQQANVKASSDGDALSLNSQYGAVQQMQKSDTTTTAGKLTVRNPDDTVLGTLDLTADSAANPVTGVS